MFLDQPIGIPHPVTGNVTATVIATDPDNDTLTYTVTGAPPVGTSTWATAKGTVTINPTTGAYTDTPTQAARLAAGTTSGADTDTFTDAVSDGQHTTTAPVSVYVSPTRFENQATTAVGSSPSGVAVSSAPNDPRMYVANTGSGTVSVINTATGQRIDANPSITSMDIAVGSSPSVLAVSADGKRLYVANTGSGTVSVINTDTYKRIDANPSIASMDIAVGSSPSALAVSADGKRLYVANRGSNTVSVIDTATYKVIDTNPTASGTNSISVGSSPSALALNGTQLYVANRGSNTVSVIDTTTYSVTNTITVGSQPSSVALGADNRLYVVNTGSGTVSVINTANNLRIDADPASPTSMDIRVGSSPSSVVFSPNGALAYVANGGDTISVIDTKTYNVVSTAAIDPNAPEPTGGHVVAVSPSGTVYVTDAVDRTVRVLTLTRGNTAPVTTAAPTVDAPDLNTGTVLGALNVTDPDGDALDYTVSGLPATTGTVTVDPTGAYTFTPTQAARDQAAQTPSTTFTVRAADGRGAITDVSVTVPIASSDPSALPYSTAPIGVGSNPTEVVISGNKVYAFNASDKTVSVIDPATNQVTATIPIGRTAEQMAAAPTGNRVYIAHIDSLSVIDTTNNSVATVPIPVRQDSEVGNFVGGVTVSQDGTRVYVSATDGTITVLNGANNAILSNTPIADADFDGFGDIQVSPDGTRLYEINSTGSRVLVIDTANMSVVDRVDLTSGTPFLRLAVSPDGTRTYATGYYGKVAVIDNTSNAQIATINIPDPAGSDPGGVWEAAFSPDGRRAYVTHADGRTVTVINPNTNAVIGTVYTDAAATKQNQYIAVAPGGTFYVTDAADGKVYAVTVANRAPIIESVGGSFNPATGQTSGVVTARDPDGDPLTYSGSGYWVFWPGFGSISVNPTTGAWVYTPDVYVPERGIAEDLNLYASDGQATASTHIVVDTFTPEGWVL